MKNAFAAVRLKRTNKPVKITKFEAFGMDCKDLMQKTVTEWYEDKEIAEIKERASSMVLDREAVSGAESALKEVTKLMASESAENDPSQIEKPIEPERKISDSWKGLSEHLDDTQKGYLKACLEGNGRAYLKDIGTPISKMEDSINSLAMDSVGDNIIEDG